MGEAGEGGWRAGGLAAEAVEVEGGRAERPRGQGTGWRGAWLCVLLVLAACGTSQDGEGPGAEPEATPPTEHEEPIPPPRSETCQPVSCEERGLNCGSIPDGCGGTLSCGGCAAGQTCGLHQPNVCGTPACKPKTCADLRASCGAAEDGCGGVLQCGTCALGQTCGGGGQANTCGTPNYGVDTACTGDGVCFLNPKPVPHDFKDVWGRSVEDFWAVGEAGFIVHGGRDGLSMLPSDAELSGIWGSAAEDIWAVGSRIVHFDGRRWSTALQPDRLLLDVHGTGARNVWAVGEGGVAYLWNGTRWERQSTGTTADLYGVWTHGAEVWAVGAGSTLRVRDAKGWRAIAPPVADVTFTGVWGTGPEDVWVTGAKSGAVLFHWNGRAWSPVPLPFSALYGISGRSSADIVVVGEEGSAHYDGSRWSTPLGNTSSRLLGAWHMADGRVVVGAGGRVQRSRPGSSWASLDQGARTDFVSVWAPDEFNLGWFADGSSVRVGVPIPEYAVEGPGNALVSEEPGRIWAAGHSGRVRLYSREAQSSGTNFFYLPPSFELHGVYPTGGLMAWLVGSDTATGEGVLVQLHGHDGWSRYSLAAPGAMTAVHGTAADDVWAVGASVIAHWNGSTWTETHDPRLPTFRAVRALARELAWALGPHSLWRWDGTRWQSLALPAGVEHHELRALFADSRNELYVSGDGGLLLRYDVTRNVWRRIDTGTRKSLRALSGGARTLIVAGEDGTVLRLYR